jgi:hypothetical protein
MASLVVSGDTSGAITIAAPAVAGTNTLTLPASTGTLVVTGGAQTIEFAAGTVSAPSITTTGDTNTGIFFPAADTIAFTEGGTESMRITSAGDVGIGTSSPTGKLEVTGGQLRVTASSASSMFLVNPSTTYADGVDIQATYNGAGSFGPLKFTTSGTERMRITSAGTVLLGTTSTSSFDEGFRVVPTGSGNSTQVIISNTGGGLPFLLNRSDDGNIIDFRRAGTNVGAISVTTTNTAYNTSSDYRLKENIAPMTGALAKVTQLKPCTYTWKANGSAGQGFIAHELQAVIPDSVTGVKDAVDAEGSPVYQGVDTSYLVATLTAAIQEQQQIINDLKARIETLEGAK